MKGSAVRRLCRAAVVGALYAAVTLLTAPLSFGAVQCRVSEALCMLPWLFPETGVGLFCGCLLANLLGGCGPLDVIFGSLATLFASVLTARIRPRWAAALPPVVLNAVMVGAALAYAASPEAFWAAFPLIAAEVAAGEALAVFALGIPLSVLLGRIPQLRNHIEKKH